jgi:hypothetical protein
MKKIQNGGYDIMKNSMPYKTRLLSLGWPNQGGYDGPNIDLRWRNYHKMLMRTVSWETEGKEGQYSDGS